MDCQRTKVKRLIYLVLVRDETAGDGRRQSHVQLRGEDKVSRDSKEARLSITYFREGYGGWLSNTSEDEMCVFACMCVSVQRTEVRPSEEIGEAVGIKETV